ncbi:MAG: glycosyltransferase [Desulfatitalea sp.]|nr:glycosyltransferase [Desulfatitalea sp.]
MLNAPTASDPNNPLVSILVYNYDTQYLRQCFDSIFKQTLLDNIEIIYFCDASNNESWDIALEYAHKFPGIMTMTRNRLNLGLERNFKNCHRMARGKYYVNLYDNHSFIPDYVKQCIKRMESDQFADFSMVRRKSSYSAALLGMNIDPLVSVYVFNYNYGRYLRQCFNSVFSQSYSNIEVYFSDNASTDDSWDIANAYAMRYPGKMQITRNRQNFGTDENVKNCIMNNQGKYHILLCSDDALMPGYIDKCVHVMETHPSAGFVIVHRTIIDENGQRSEELPFYNQSCVIPGNEQAAVYMLAGVNPSISQIMYNTARTKGKSAYGGLAARWYGTRIMDFNMCCEFDTIYIKTPLLMHRLHSQNDYRSADDNLMQCIGPYVLQHQFAEIASFYNLTKVADRLPESLDKVSRLCLRFCMQALIANDEKTALRYFHLSKAISLDVIVDPVFEQLDEYWTADPSEKIEILNSLKSTDNLVTRSISYDPPAGSISLEI